MDAIIKIKQVPDVYAESVGLDKYNRSRMPQCSDKYQAAEGLDGRYITGLDEDASEINQIEDETVKQEKKAEIAKLRTAIEKRLGKDISGISTFWETFFVEISTDSDLILNMANPLDVVKHRVLVSNGLAAPDINSTGMPKYINA